ncbi:GNAT family N-acetyltransferase [Leifsonia sp. Le1]|uniref:GNAT family N-acetyltransferase n=1 Tax=Leifsonia sp. Le1 TaxID=3404918 RepID=UPI003EB77058
MDLTLTPLDVAADRDELASFLSANRFPFHAVERLTRAQAEARIDRGDYAAPDNEAFWITTRPDDRVGLIVFQEVADGGPMIDLRLSEAHRGRGIGTAALREGTNAIFERHPEILRIEGNTRIDNVAMRKTFEAAGYVKEAHYRDGWTTANEPPLDAVAYAILRRDWVSGVTTPVVWGSDAPSGAASLQRLTSSADSNHLDRTYITSSYQCCPFSSTRKETSVHRPNERNLSAVTSRQPRSST